MKPVVLVPASSDPLACASERILDHYRDRLPELDGCRILVPENRCAGRFRAALLRAAEQRGHHALLGVSIETLEQWLTHNCVLRGRVLPRAAQELVLVEALRGHAKLYGNSDPWQLGARLLSLFEELTRNETPIDDTLDSFRSLLQQGYGIGDDSHSLQQEAAMLHTLWHAWRQQLEEDGLLDSAGALRQRLQLGLDPPGEDLLWLVGYTALSPSEARWLRQLLERGRARLILHGDAARDGYHPDACLHRLLGQLGMEGRTDSPGPAEDPLHDLVDSLFGDQGDLRQRAAAFARRHPRDPVRERLASFTADTPEDEARAVALQVRRWLLDGVRPIAVITEDRRLARRVRALLEAAQVQMEDTGGWALSTTSAAAMLERWLETVEEDFACGPLLDLLKSPFACFGERDRHLALTRRLEQDIILHENIARGLERYRHHLELRNRRLPDWSEATFHSLQQLLNTLDHAAGPLRPLLQGEHPLASFTLGLLDSLRELQAWENLAQDAAGQRVLELLEDLHRIAAESPLEVRWLEFRNWLGGNLERATFRPPTSGSPVQLLTLEQSRLQQFGATVIAGCSRELMPGSAAGQAFFNQRVRAQLGLPDWSQTIALRLHHFCRALQCSGRTLLTRHRERDGEAVAASPWLELLEVFYRHAYQAPLEDAGLADLLAQPASRPASPDRAPLPPRQQHPRPTPPARLLPRSWSASTHQRLIDCPYRFFAADTLALKPMDEIREALSKADYGSLVHRVLEAFTGPVRGLPGPWTGPLQEGQREAALGLLRKISRAVFAEAIEENFEARSWRDQWLAILPDYVDWEIERRRQWQLRNAELQAERVLSPTLTLRGRIDRVDQRDGRLALLDYKTGQAPRPQDVLAGEAVQLPSYALLLDAPVEQLDYLQFRRDGLRPGSCASGEDVLPLLHAIGERMVELDEALRGGATLPAWGDAGVCRHCEFSVLCRREAWEHDHD